MAINLASPGIKITETDLVASVPAAGATIGAVAGQFNWGPIEDPVLVVSETELVAKFGKPNATNIIDFLTAANYLSYSPGAYVVRAANTSGALNATSEATTGGGGPGAGLLIENDEKYDFSFADGSANHGPWIAKYAGVLGNSLKVSTCATSTAWQSTLTGDFSVSAGSASVTGANGSIAQVELTVGDFVVLGGRTVQVRSIESNTAFTLTGNHLSGATGETNVARKWEFYEAFEGAPGTSSSATVAGAIGDEMHIAVADEDGLITGAKGTVLEKFSRVSKATNGKAESGAANYYKDVVNTTSKYIRWIDKDAAGTNWDSVFSNGLTFTPVANPKSYSLAGGADGTAPTDGQRIAAFTKLASKTKYNISLIAMGKASATVINNVIADVAEFRKDVVVCFSPESGDVVNNSGNEVTDIKAFADSVTRSTYAFMDANWKYQYDKYNDKYVWVPCSADAAGSMARIDANQAPWFSPAGYANGRILNAVKLAWNPGQFERDDLYKYGVNPIITQPGRGTVLFGDKTFQTKTGSFSRVNVRRLFITIEKAIGTLAEDLLFEQNDAGTRLGFVNTVEPYLRSVQGGRGITDFKVVCDDTNNPDSVVNANEFIADIYVRPTSSINFIQLNFVSVRGASAFAELG